MNRRYNILHLPILSFFSKRLYRDVARNWRGANMGYLFLLLSICLIPPSLSLRKDLIRSLNSSQVELINQLPDIRIVDGMVKVDQSEPYLIKSSGKTVAIIDTTGSMNYIDDDEVNLLLTESSLIVRRGKNEFNTLDLSQVGDFHINREIANHWIQMAKSAVAPVSYGIFLLLSYTFTVLFLLLASIVGLMLSAILHCSLRFTGAMRVAAAAITPSIILITASIALRFPVPGVVYAVITVIYLLIGILSCARMSEKDEAGTQLRLTSLLDEKTAAEHHQRHAA